MLCYAIGMSIAVSLSGLGSVVHWRGLPRMKLRRMDRVGFATTIYAVAIGAGAMTCYVCA